MGYQYFNLIVGIGLALLFVGFIFVLMRIRENRMISIRKSSLTMEELENYAKVMALEHDISSRGRKKVWPLKRLNENYTFMLQVYKELNDYLLKKRAIPPAAEWLLDNFYTIEEQVKSIRRDLTKKSYYRLPILKTGPFRGYTRIFAIAIELVGQVDGKIDEHTLNKYFEAYQSHHILMEREICVIPIMIQMALMENIRILCEKIKETQIQWEKADDIVEKYWTEEDFDMNKTIKLFKGQIVVDRGAKPSFVEHLSYRLRRSGHNYSNVLREIDENLDKFGTNTEAIAQNEHKAQAVNAVSIGNCIVSLKYVSKINWVDLFEATSFVDKILKDDPDGTYPLMDVNSRNYYRNQVENLAETFKVSELHIAKEAIGLAKKASLEKKNKFEDENIFKRRTHVGCYLFNSGLEELEKIQKGKRKSFKKFGEFMTNHPGVIYLSSLGMLTLIVLGLIIDYSIMNMDKNFLIYGILIGLVSLIPATEIVVTLVHWIICKIKRPSFFPCLELKEGIPEEMSTMIVVPAILTDEKRVEELLENIENHYASNKEDNLYFALIGAFRDANEQNIEGDKKVLAAAFEGIRALNMKYAKGEKDIFYFYHRIRKYNESDDNWTGWERKRGALMEFNEMILGSTETSFYYYSNALLPTAKVKYVITLDADTILPLDMARKMIGTMAHPLNIPVVDKEKGVVVEGYGLMQPRISFDIESANRSFFSRIFTGQEGMDSYARAISDVYQDLFGEGIFTGKGIYDLTVFQSVMKDVIPENAILSHDLLEGSYVRAALVNDMELVDSYPSKYNSFIARLHRWIRGDWQLLPWLGRRVRDKSGKLIKNPLNYISIWKIIDNMRRSLLAPSIMLMMLLGCSILPGSIFFWLGLSIAILGLPLITTFIGQIFGGGLRLDRIRRHIPGFFGLKANLLQFVLTIIFLPYHAMMVIHAVSITMVRVLITKRNMLEWTTTADVEKTQVNSLKNYFRTMMASPAIALIIAVLIFIFRSGDIYIGIIALLLWVPAPFIAHYISQDIKSDRVMLGKEDLDELSFIARKTWRYFEEFANAKNNYLPPDNFQEDPPRGIAYRTSPTNIGLGLLATLSARDFGYIGIAETSDLLIKTVSSIEKMEKWNGHLYNWYDTRNLVALKPRYVSTVDSGNYVSYLITLSEGLKDYYTSPIVDYNYVKGIIDTIRCGLGDGEELPSDFNYFDFINKDENINVILWDKALDEIITSNYLRDFPNTAWKIKVDKMIRMFKAEINNFAPWVAMTDNIPKELYEEDLADETNILLELLKTNMKLNEIGKFDKIILKHVDTLINLIEKKKGIDHNGLKWLNELKAAIKISNAYSVNFIKQYNNLIHRTNTLSENCKFKYLYNERRGLFSIGYNIEESWMTNSYYDLLASEARLTSYLTIARGEVPASHWFMLGRSLTVIDNYKGLVSWSGTMFEYLMPLLVMRSYRNTLLDETYSFVIKSQIKYGKQRGMPWGSSESSFNSLDINLDYNYKAIGVPWLGLKRGLVEDAVTAPYSTFLALLVNPFEAMLNIKQLKADGLEGPYGYYEAADYTQERLSVDSERVIVKSFMAHHEGMTFVALDNYLNGNKMQRRFSEEPFINAARLLLQEKVPVNVVFTKEKKEKIIPFKGLVYKDDGAFRRFIAPNQDIPNSHILSNGNYSVMVTDQGTGFSRTQDYEISRWREDVVIGQYGMFFYVNNINKKEIWSSTYAPLNILPNKYEVSFTSDKATYSRKDGDIETSTEIAVTSGDNAEIRRIKIKNTGETSTLLDLTSYFEVVMAPQNADLAHPAFSNLFVKTEFNQEYQALIAKRRPRSENDRAVWIGQIAVSESEIIGDIQYETDRMQFIGRGKTVANPNAIYNEKPLSNTVGAVLDPVFSLRTRLDIKPGQTVRVYYATIIEESRESLMEQLEKYSTVVNCNAAFWLALARSQVEAKYLNIKAQEMELFQSMISHLIFDSPLRIRNEEQIKGNHKGQSSLWPYAISGDRPIVMLEINNVDNIDILYSLLKAHEYWRLKSLKVDFVILSQEDNSYENPLYSAITEIVYSSQTHDVLNPRGDVFILNTNNMAPDDTKLLESVARMTFRGDAGTIEEQLKSPTKKMLPELLEKSVKRLLPSVNPRIVEEKDLMHFNSIGGFAKNGKEYVIKLGKDKTTPAPWSNIISNKEFGFIVTESGGGFTWCENSRENKLSPWSNDPVTDKQGEMFYLRDETSEVWSITPLPIRESGGYTIRHGFGYSEFHHLSHGICQSLTQFVPIEGTVKISIIKLTNESKEDRDISLTYYMHPVLGVSTTDTSLHITTSQTGAGTLIVENPYNTDFSDRLCFIDSSINEKTVTGDRREFFGTGKEDSPDSLKRKNLSGNLGAGLDPCAAMQVKASLKVKEEKEIIFIMGITKEIEDVAQYVEKYRIIENAKEALSEVKIFWEKKLQVIQVDTPDSAMNIMLNGWLQYQVISCRLWGRSGFYQAGGAFGFRDQLQDAMAVATIWPDIARNQILLHAKHQFAEGDVLHWWHEPTGKGTRTRSSDDYLWLPYVVAEYIMITGDKDILKVEVPFVTDEVLKDSEQERYSQPGISSETATIYDHCILSLDNGLRFGKRGLPLMRNGDWNDGMNTVGNLEMGESVWLGWFLISTLEKFAPICRDMGSDEKANRYSEIAIRIAESIEKNCWDGNWYTRAYFDNGDVLGSIKNKECKIDSIAQTWSVISGYGDKDRSKKAMKSLENNLVMWDEGLIKLLTPPFNEGDMEPGYIKGYVPGVRENGGQYTHAAAWVVAAFAMLGNGDKAFDLFSLINPIRHTCTNRECFIYKAEPYVMAADVYAEYPHVGRGGWTWYTGAAGWMYKAGLENILGFSKTGDELSIKPCIPKNWLSYSILYKYMETTYSIKISNPKGLNKGVLSFRQDGEILETRTIKLVDDKQPHNIEVIMV
ncbi:MAG: glucoamylase family protein [Eubacteriales bacterium]